MTPGRGSEDQRSIVCGVDGSHSARAALRVATRVARELGQRLVVAYVVQPKPTVDRFGSNLVDSANVGSRGRGPVKAALLGGVSADLIGVARCPVLVIPPAFAAVVPRQRRESALVNECESMRQGKDDSGRSPTKPGSTAKSEQDAAVH